MNRNFTRGSTALVLALIAAVTGLAHPRPALARKMSFTVNGDSIPCGEYEKYQAIVWYGDNPRMTLAQLAAYAAPVVWFSPDEPLLDGAAGKGITVPSAFPFEDPSSTPVVYYRVRNILQRADANESAFMPDSSDRGGGIVDLSEVAGIDLDFFFYYPSEAGLGGHVHDVESAQFKLAVWRRDTCKTPKYHLLVTTVTGKAHGLQWYDNTLTVDEYTRFPMSLLIEEGKHATCTDKNGDGYYTPNYDVNRYVNDAWAVRDVIRSGALFTGSYQSWMTKVRKAEDRVFPPLPDDSPLRAQYTRRGEYSANNAIYSLRPFPSAEKAPQDLVRFIADKGDPNWPSVEKNTGAKQFSSWFGSEPFVKSLSIAFYSDGSNGIAGVFPLFIVKNFEEPMTGGFITNRVIVKDKHFRDMAWMLHYTPSASRWLDSYFSAGVERDREDAPGATNGEETSQTDFVFETGIKMRVNVQHSAFKFLTKVTDFWGVRVGIKNYGFHDIERLRYVFEIGAGTW